MIKLYTATFADASSATRAFAKRLTHAWKVTYRPAGDENGPVTKKYGFSGSAALAEKHFKLPKRYKLLTSEVVETVETDAPAKLTTAKPKKVKPFHKGETVMVSIGGGVVTGTVQRVGTKYTYISAERAVNDIKIATEHVRKIEAPMAVAA
jgi:hypothetical protein